jgi:hypothetical protein
MTAAFDEVLSHFSVLARTEGLDPELIHLLEDARRWVVSGVDRILSIGDPHSVDGARMLLELELLLCDFAATPENLQEWAAEQEWRRNAKFGFGKLREREEQRRGLDKDTVIAPRDYWITHSTNSHPKPLKDVTAPTSHWSFSLLNSLADLVGHAWSAVLAGRACVEASGVRVPAAFDDLPIASYLEFKDRSHRVLNSHIPDAAYEALSQPRPKQQSPRKFWQVEQDDGQGQ